MATSDLRALTQAFRRAQLSRATVVAALVAAYYRSKVDPDDPLAVDEWLEQWLPRILAQSTRGGVLAAAYGNRARTLDLPGGPSFTITPSEGSIVEQVRRSLLVVGPGDYRNKASEIRQLDVSPQQVRALLTEAKQVTARKVAASTVRHVQSGARQTIIDAAAADPVSLGYVRVTKANPCWFCAMLASRGLVFAEDSFDLSDPRFTGDGTAKVHDECGCSMKVIYRREDPLLADTEKFTDLWAEWGAGGGDAALRFRRGYEHYQATGDKLPYDVVADINLYRARNSPSSDS